MPCLHQFLLTYFLFAFDGHILCIISLAIIILIVVLRSASFYLTIHTSSTDMLEIILYGTLHKLISKKFVNLLLFSFWV